MPVNYARVDHDHSVLSESHQGVLLALPRSTLYYQSTALRESKRRIKIRINSLYLEDPYSGSFSDSA